MKLLRIHVYFFIYFVTYEILKRDFLYDLSNILQYTIGVNLLLFLALFVR